MPLDSAQLAAFRRLAQALDRIDAAAYAACGRDPSLPILGLGAPDAPVCFFGRDPGAEEVRHGQPFVGGSGQLLRSELYRHLELHGHLDRGGAPAYSFERGLAAGERFFWISTVPYKPLHNKAWAPATRRRFQPLILQLLYEQWRGSHVITLGTEAFDWFGLAAPGERERLERFWRGDDKYEASLAVTLAHGGARRVFHLHPLPHPSPANAKWKAHFPRLLRARLDALLPAPA